MKTVTSYFTYTTAVIGLFSVNFVICHPCSLAYIVAVRLCRLIFAALAVGRLVFIHFGCDICYIEIFQVIRMTQMALYVRMMIKSFLKHLKKVRL